MSRELSELFILCLCLISTSTDISLQPQAGCSVVCNAGTALSIAAHAPLSKHYPFCAQTGKKVFSVT